MKFRNVSRPLSTALLHCVLSVASVAPMFIFGSAHAQTAPSADELSAEAEFAAGVTLMKGGQCDAALRRFRESQRLSPASGTLLDIAYCEQELGHSASAFTAYQQALPIAQASGKPAHVQLAREGITQLTPLLGWLWLRLSTPVERWQVRIDGMLVDGDLSALVPVDPGEHNVLARLNQIDTQGQVISVRAGQRIALDFEDPVPRSAPPTPPPQVNASATPKPMPSKPAAHQDPLPPREPERSSTPVVAWAFTGAGSAALATGVGLFLVARYRYDHADCPGNICDGEPEQVRLSAGNQAIWAGVSAGVGAALLGTGLVLFWTRSSDTETALNASVTPWSMQLEGSF